MSDIHTLSTAFLSTSPADPMPTRFSAGPVASDGDDITDDAVVEATFVCECGRSFGTQRGLSLHRRVHNKPTVATASDHPNRVAIVGYTPSRSLAPYDDPDVEVWGMNNLHIQDDIDPTKFTRWFDLHPTERIKEDDKHVAWLEGGADGLPVYCFDPQPEWPTAVQFPTKALTDKFGRYFTNSVSWMTGFAILEVAWAVQGGEPVGAEIGVYGIDMAQGTEYAAQRPSCEYFLGIAAGAGISVTIPVDSDLLKAAALYGAEQSGPMMNKMVNRERELATKEQQLAQRNNELRAESQKIEAMINQCRGAREDVAYWRGVWMQPEADRDAPQNQSKETP